MTKRVTRKGDAISFSYDRLNRVCTKTYAATAVTCGDTSGNYLVSYAYDLAGRLIGANDNSASIHAAGGTASYAETLTYDALNRPLTASWTPAPSQSLPTGASVTFTHAYDATNRRIGQSATDNSWWSIPASASNVGYTANSLNQYTAVGPMGSQITPTYDGNGNLTYDGTFTYCYDTENRLISVLSAGTCASPTTTVATYAYDAQGRRKSKTVSGTTTVFVADADNREVVEYNGATGAVQNWYAYGLGPNEVLNQTNGAGTTRATLIPDIQGSFIGSLSSSGALTKTGYRPYGESSSTSGSFRYTGQRIDPETNGLYYYRARMYAPGWGRFMQADPVGYRGGSNLYAYVNNDPLNLADPMGLAVGDWWDLPAISIVLARSPWRSLPNSQHRTTIQVMRFGIQNGCGGQRWKPTR